MQVIDISQEVFSCCVYPGDPAPRRQILESMEAGAKYNLSAFSMCAHNGTHVDAPAHFLRDGKTVDQMPLTAFVGSCCVVRHTGEIDRGEAEGMLKKAQGEKRILIAGDAVVTEEAAQVFAQAQLLLLGNESQSVGSVDAPMAVHKILLGAGTALLEGIRLAGVKEGRYILCAAPLNLGGTEGAPCRAVLMTKD